MRDLDGRLVLLGIKTSHVAQHVPLVIEAVVRAFRTGNENLSAPRREVLSARADAGRRYPRCACTRWNKSNETWERARRLGNMRYVANWSVVGWRPPSHRVP